MTVQIVPASAQDAEDLARLIIIGNANDKMFNRIVSPGKVSTPAQKAEQLRWRTARNALNMQRRGTYWFKAVDTKTSETIGFVGAVAPKSEESAWDGTLCESMDAEWFAKYMKATMETKEALLEGREDVWCKLFRGRSGVSFRMMLLTDGLKTFPLWLSIRITKAVALEPDCSPRSASWQIRWVRMFTWSQVQ